MKITLAIPTRHQPERMKRLLQNIVDTANRPEELDVIIGVDQDDPGSHKYDHERLNITNLVFRPKSGCGIMQNGMFKESKGDIFFTINDDCIIHTKGWDDEIIKIYEQYPDGIVYVVVNDLMFKDKLAVFPCQSRKAIEIMGGIADVRYIQYRYDDHIHHVYDILRRLGHDRIVYRDDLVFEHDHFKLVNGQRVYAKAGAQMTTNDGELYYFLRDKRKADAVSLATAIDPVYYLAYMDVAKRIDDRQTNFVRVDL